MIIISNNQSDNQKKLLAKKQNPIFKTAEISSVKNECPNKVPFLSSHAKSCHFFNTKTKVTS